MVLCPVALAVGCGKCPVFAVCPAKGLIGDYRADGEKKSSKSETAAAKKKK